MRRSILVFLVVVLSGTFCLGAQEPVNGESYYVDFCITWIQWWEANRDTYIRKAIGDDDGGSQLASSEDGSGDQHGPPKEVVAKVVAALLDATRSVSRDVRAEAALALARMGAGKDRLLELTHDDDLRVRCRAWVCLGLLQKEDELLRPTGLSDVETLAVMTGLGLLDKPGDEALQRVRTAARSANVGRLLHVSALGAAVDAPSHYLRSKGEAEKLIREQGGTLDWTIFQPSVMFGPGDTFLNRFARLLASVPGVLPIARPNARFQPVFVDDVVDALLRCLRGGASSRQPYQLGGPQIYTLREVVCLVAKITGQRRWIVGLPNVAGRLEAAVFDFVPGRPFSSDNYRSLKVDSVCTEDGFERLRLKPHSMAASARQYVGALEDNARLSIDRAATGRS